MSGNAVRNDQFYTYADYCQLDDDKRYEIINGVIYLMTAPNSVHQEISSNLHREISAYLKGKKCKVFHAAFDVFLPEEGETIETVANIVQPDIVVVCDKNKIIKRGCFGSPDLVIEILSPSTSKKDTKEKFNLYQKHGVLEYWLVNPFSQIIDRFSFDKDTRKYKQIEYFHRDDAITPIIFPDLQIKLEEVFPELSEDDYY